MTDDWINESINEWTIEKWINEFKDKWLNEY